MKSSTYSRYLNIIAKPDARSAQVRRFRRTTMGRQCNHLAHPSISRHGLSRCDDLLKSTKLYYPAKIFRLLSTAAMTMIRTLVFSPDRRDVRIARAIRMKAPQ
jgi:hypothetical protein